ncbi:class I SAM-dependent methyltransferase [Isoptericola sp. b441]|uniref:Class I SAM-dependent methyltransferase n=1 Tax=Actinotalea lenta TaxID=3064654 RepID=A0ABT9DDQ4_9CELL|nr:MULTISPECIES: class I SAM-dependent methyltransferase [unclassified Isoptericola]MDO8108549.1 class I SAM-dependent methyltransferase [Isoptericola sp. b441]MDO8119959.1 class I SAM-dependent methyltransferase [Isoptericola sp. b490]
MPTYDTTVDPDAANTSHALMLDLVGGGSRVLDVGCATGYLAQALAARGCTVSGVEMDPAAAEIARPLLDRLVVGNLAELDLVAELGAGQFDVVVLGDVLEHLEQPEAVLRSMVPLLAPGGSFVISTPNVAHGSLRLGLLLGRWEYTDRGLLDRTHLRFFTRASLRALLRTAGLVPTELRRTVVDPLGGEVRIDPATLPAGLIDWVRAQPDADTYQFVWRAVPDTDAAVAQLARERDELTDRLGALGAELASARRERDDARGSLDELQRTRVMRWSALPRGAYRRVRTAMGRGR